MTPLIIPEKENTISVILDKENRNFQLKGRSFPEHSAKFFKPIIDWIDEYKKDPLDEMKIEMNFVYFNTSSAKLILEIINELDGIHKQGNSVHLMWYYLEGDEDMLDAGEEYASMVSLPFTFRSFLEEDLI